MYDISAMKEVDSKQDASGDELRMPLADHVTRNVT